MAFLTPLAFSLLLLLPLIVALYFLKLRRERLTVASTYLWESFVRDRVANAPWQRLRPSWLLLLQLLFVVALMLALARPFRWRTDVAGTHLILVVDTSASMGAGDEEPNRLSAATAEALLLAERLPASVPVTLIEAGQQAEVPLAQSRDRALLRRALAGLAPGSSGADMVTALELAQALGGGSPGAEIVVLSDGGVSLPQGASPPELTYLPVGNSGENQAIAAMTLETGPGGERRAFVRLHNYGWEAVERRLTLHAGDRLLAARNVRLPAGEDTTLTFADLAPEITVVEADLQGVDLLPTDDRATAVAPVETAAAIQVVGPGNRFLETGLALLPGVEVSALTLEAYAAGSEAQQEAGLAESARWLTVFDGVLPPGDHYPPGALLFLAPLRSTPFFSVTGTLALPGVQPANAADPLLRYVDLRGMVVEEAVRVPLPPWAQAAILGEGQDGAVAPLLFSGSVEGRPVAVLAFDLRRSDLPLRVAFPVLLANLVEHLAPGAGADRRSATIAPGEAVGLSLPAGAVAAVMVGPDGQETRLPLPEGGNPPIFTGTATPGAYHLYAEMTNGERYLLSRFAANLFDAQESAVAPRPGLAAGSAGNGGAAAAPAVRQEWWRWPAVAALVLLLAEWLVQYRGGLAYALAWPGRVRR